MRALNIARGGLLASLIVYASTFAGAEMEIGDIDLLYLVALLAVCAIALSALACILIQFGLPFLKDLFGRKS